MDVQYFADELTVKKAKSVRAFSIITLVLVGAYLLEGLYAFLFALIPIPILGFVIFLVLSFIEFALLAAAVIFGIAALVPLCCGTMGRFSVLCPKHFQYFSKQAKPF